MATNPPFSPTLLRKWVATELRRMRITKGVSIEQVADRVGKSKGWASHLETGRQLPGKLEVEALLTWYGHPERADDFNLMVKAAKKNDDWWADNFDLPEWTQLYLGLESGVDKLSSFEPIVVPGLCQTPAYAEAVFRSARSVSDEQVARGQQLRTERQRVLDNSAPYPRWIHIVIDQSVITRIAGTAAITKAQMEHLRELADLPKITIRILPRTSGTFAGAEGAFTVMDFAPEFYDTTGIVYVENRHEAHFYDIPHVVDGYRDALARLEAAALSPTDSADFISAAIKDI